MTSDPTSPAPIQIVIEQEGGAQKYKIQSDQLEHIGTQLRGKRQFSVFNSIVLPVIVTILTTLFTGMFQYISWTNSVRLQNATDNAEKASETYENAAAAISKRRYATWLFIPAVRDLANAGRRPQMAEVTPATTGTIPKMDVPPAIGDAEISLSNLQLQLVKQRYESYYGQLKTWNESYDQLLTDIDYNLDRPILLQAELRSEAVRVFAA